MGQAASSMCRFKGCRYKKSKTGLHLRSIEEPYNRMPAEQGGTTGLDHPNSRAPLSTSHQQPQALQHQQQHHNNHHHHHHHSHNQPHQQSYDPELARMESWMDENPDFVQDYFIRKATRQVVDSWLVSHATAGGAGSSSTSGGGGPMNNCTCPPATNGGNPCPSVSPASAGGATGGATGVTIGCGAGAGNSESTNSSPTHGCGPNCSSRSGSGATTPVRKISAHEFERGGLLKPIVNTIDGTPTFLSVGHPTNDANLGCNTTTSTSTNAHRPQRLSRNELRHLDEKQLIFELVKDICNELDVRSLCHKILQNVSILLKADRGSLFLVEGRCSSASPDTPNKCLVSKLFDVCPRSTLAEMEAKDEVRVAWGTGIAGHVAESGHPVNIPDAYKDERFNDEIDSQTGYRTKALLCMPIKDASGVVVGVAQVINKLNGDRFTENDENVFSSYLQFCGIGLRNAKLYEQSQLEIKRNQVLLDLARMIFEEQSTIEHMVLRILTHMQSLIQCQRVQILLVHEASKGSFSRVFDFEANDLCQDDSSDRTSPFESRFPINIGVTGHVATTGETVNIVDAYVDHRFDPSVDECQSFKHRSILCMAIKNSLGQIIGVIQLVNKFNCLKFTRNDENFVEAFAIFCGMGIHNTHMYEKAIVAMAKQSVTLEVLSYHASASMDDAGRLKSLKVPSSAYFMLHDFKFDDILMDDDDTLKACLRMFLDLDFVERFHIDYEVLCRWLLSVKKNYRNVTYHNWRHAFNVAQMMFSILTATQWWKIFGEIECLALIIACLCHDLDHRGTNNSFQIKASSPLAQLYSTSTMEHHHFDQCLMILNSPGNQVLANLSSDDYSQVIHVLEDAILSTDLAVYFRKRGPFLQEIQPGSMVHWCNEEPRTLLRAMSMTVCDLSAITKPWEIEKRVADLVSSEFFEQGDIERQELNITPIDIMNREKEDQLPMMQVGFIDSICMPIYEAFALLSDKLVPLFEGVKENKHQWLLLAQAAKNKQNILEEMSTSDSSNNSIESCIDSTASSSSRMITAPPSTTSAPSETQQNQLNKMEHINNNNNNNYNYNMTNNNNNTHTKHTVRAQRRRRNLQQVNRSEGHANNSDTDDRSDNTEDDDQMRGCGRATSCSSRQRHQSAQRFGLSNGSEPAVNVVAAATASRQNGQVAVDKAMDQKLDATYTSISKRY